MATLGAALASNVLGHSEAEKAFRPWWDNFEDHLIYGLITLGKLRPQVTTSDLTHSLVIYFTGLIVLPTAIINGTPLDCTLCQESICPKNFTSDLPDPKFNAWWVKKFCTLNGTVDSFILYFPFVLLIIALLLILIERGFITIFRAGLELNNFYKLLQSEDLLDENPNKENEEDQNEDDNKIAIEIAQSFGPSSNYFKSYLIRTIFEFVTATCLLVYFAYSGFHVFNTDEEFLYCPVGQHFYQCAGHPQEFYKYVFYISTVIVIMYILCCIYNFLWLFIPQLGSLSGLMNKYKNQFKNENENGNDIVGDLHDVYYNNKDLKLLLDLLASSSGIAPCIRILCLFDKNLRQMAKVGNLKFMHQENETEGKVDLGVEFEDPKAIKNIFSQLDNAVCVYTIEITPSLPSVSHFKKSFGISRHPKNILKFLESLKIFYTFCLFSRGLACVP